MLDLFLERGAFEFVLSVAWFDPQSHDHRRSQEGCRAADELPQRVCEVRVLNVCPVNLHCFAQAGFTAAGGDASKLAIPKRVDAG